MGLILVEKKSGKRIDLSKVLKNGKYTELAVPGEEYYLIDSATGKTPEDITDIDKTYSMPKSCVSYRKPRKLDDKYREQKRRQMAQYNMQR